MAIIASLSANEILASGGTPTIETTVTLDDGSIGVASVPFGASFGSHEAVVLFDEDPKRFRGRGMLQAVDHVNTELADLLVGQSCDDLRSLDQQMIALDGTQKKERLGGNAILSVSLACARAAAVSSGQELYAWLASQYAISPQESLPYPMMVLLEGGKHAADSTDFQEYLVVPSGAPSVWEGLRWGQEVMAALKDLLKRHGFSTNVGNEGAFAPAGMTSNEQPLELLVEAIELAGFAPGSDIQLAMDPACSELYKDGVYVLEQEKETLSSEQMIERFTGFVDRYPFFSVEDALAEDDWEHWPALSSVLSERDVLCVGDDLTVTNVERLTRALDEKAITALLVKYNQAGTISETMDAMELCRKNNIATIVSHRGGGETNDTSMIDVAVAGGAQLVKVGPTRGERVGKYNRLVRIERDRARS